MSTMKTKQPRTKKNIQYSDPGKILDLVESLTDDACAHLQIKINQYITSECEAEQVFQIVVQVDRMEAYIEVIGLTVLSRKMKIRITSNLIEVLKSPSEQSELLSNFGADFQAVVTPHIKDSSKKRIVMVPVSVKPFSVIVCVMAPKVLEELVSNLVSECFSFCMPALKKTIELEYECTMKQKCQQLLRVARRLFIQVASLDALLLIAMEQAKQLTKAEHCSVLLIDAERMELVASESTQEGKTIPERRYAMNIGVVGEVLKTGNLINLKSSKEHPAFNAAIDSLPGVDCKNLLCFPIREQDGIIGVGILINKIGDPYFDAMDEEMALAYSIYCGVCIMHSVVYQKIQEAHVRNALANELIMYHMKVGESEIVKVLKCTGYHSHPHFNSLHFNLRALPAREMPCYALKMFSELGYIKKYRMNEQKLVCFILHVKKGYRDVPYHNWFHGFGVAQWAFAALSKFKLVSHGYFTELQGLIFLIAGLVHDLDHRGTTNSFQMKGQTTLAALYSSEGSVMERHHLAQAMCILNTEGCDILSCLPRKDYDRAIMLLRDYILASDLANYLKNLNEYKSIAMDFQKGNRVHTSALMAIMMNAADLADQIKDWGCIKKTAAAVLTEFFRQGDEEKSRGDLPAEIMDRDKCFIPDLEIQFLSTTCLPLFDCLGKIIPKAVMCSKIIQDHIKRWIGSRPIFAEVPTTAGLSILLSPQLDHLIEQNLMEIERLRQKADEEEENY